MSSALIDAPAKSSSELVVRPAPSLLCPTFTVIIPALNEERMIASCLRALIRQSLAPREFEVILVDNGSTDRTVEIGATFASALRLTVLRREGCNISEARNAAVELAKSTYLVFLDADCVPPPDWLKHGLEHLRVGDGGVLGAFYTVPAKSRWVAKAWYGNFPTSRQGPVSYVPSGSLFVSRSLFCTLGGFDPAMPTSEDFEFCQRVHRAGYSVLGYRDLSAVHVGTPQTLAAFFRKQRWHGTGVRTILSRDRMNLAYLKTVIQSLYVPLLLFSVLASAPIARITRLSWMPAIPLLALLVVSFAMAVYGAHQRKQWTLAFPLTVLYAVYSAARGVSLLGFAAPRGVRSQPNREK